MQQKTKDRLWLALFLAWTAIAIYAGSVTILGLSDGSDAAPTHTNNTTTTTVPGTANDEIPGYNPECDPDPTDDRIPENVSLPNCGDDMVFTDTATEGTDE